MAHVPPDFYLKARVAGTHKRFRRVGRHKRTGQLVWLGTAYATLLRTRGLLRTVFKSDEWPAIVKQATKQGLGLKLIAADVTPNIIGKEDNVHPDLLGALQSFMDRFSPNRILDIISGFRSYASQLSLWLLYLSGLGNPAAKPGTSKHEATGGYKTARAVDAYINGIAFWTWVDQHGLRRKAEALGLRQPYPSEPWHVEKAGL